MLSASHDAERTQQLRQFYDVVASLLEADGSRREVTFERPTWAGVENLIDGFKRSFERGSATNRDAQTPSHPDPFSVSATVRERGYVHLVFDVG